MFEAIAPPPRLLVPLSDYLATERIQVREAGMTVRAGEQLAPPTEGGHAPLAPYAGRVLGVSDAPLLTGLHAPVIELEGIEETNPDHQRADAQDFVWTAADDVRLLDVAAAAAADAADPHKVGQWIERIRDAGVWASRRMSPDLLAQLHQSLRRPVDTILCTVLDVDPSACLSAALAAQYPLELIAGIALLRSITRANRASIAIDSRIPPAWTSALRHAGKSQIRIVPMINEYPQADPTLLLYALLHRRLRPMRLPTEQGAIVLDAAAAIAVGRVAFGAASGSSSHSAMLSVPLVVRDHALRQSFFVFAAVGTPLGDVVQQARVSLACTVFRGGDVLRDVRVPREAIVAGGELIVHASPPEPPVNPDPCIRCGWCVDSCPTRVQPAGVLEASQHADVPLAEHFGIEACIECGICSFVCPSILPLLPAIRTMRQMQNRSG